MTHPTGALSTEDLAEIDARLADTDRDLARLYPGEQARPPARAHRLRTR